MCVGDVLPKGKEAGEEKQEEGEGRRRGRARGHADLQRLDARLHLVGLRGLARGGRHTRDEQPPPTVAARSHS